MDNNIINQQKLDEIVSTIFKVLTKRNLTLLEMDIVISLIRNQIIEKKKIDMAKDAMTKFNPLKMFFGNMGKNR